MHSSTATIFDRSQALMTDMYQLTMAHGYWQKQMHERRAVFNLFFRSNPFKGGYGISCGLEQALKFLKDFHFSNADLSYLQELKGSDGRPIFESAFLNYLQSLKFDCDVDAIPEGEVVFANEPLIRIKGPIIQAQLVETALLNIINFQTLIATKAARISEAAQGDQIMEFGFRRAQGMDGALSGSRAAYIGGCSGTSNVYAGKTYGIPVLGTHSHSWVQAFDSELLAFEAFAETMPNNTVLLVDTYHTPSGIDNAIEVAKKMLNKGYKMNGIRLDSGDLAYLSQLARKKLNAAGLDFIKIVASNDLDEYLVTSLKHQEAAIDMWGIGTKLITAFDQPALGGVYKLAAIEVKPDVWEDKIKLSEQSIKVNTPGLQQVKRFYKDGRMLCDMIYDERSTIPATVKLIDPFDPTKVKTVDTTQTESRDILKPVIRKGQLVYDLPDLNQIKVTAQQNLGLIDKSIRRLTNPHIYPVGLEESLFNKRMQLIINYKRKYHST